ncbi:hypothetical protein N7470_008521 [Penicillium chermesinum]|nr:hypothetical protein N7470_008521 [Penicillium chermesinum]
MTMNLKRTRAQSKSLSPRADSEGTPTSRNSSSPRPSSASRKKTESAETKAKRTRTGCLTCRERHLKCDEALGRCLNCRKSNRVCRRGVRLNFIDIQTVAPPQVIDRPNGSKVTFRDDSRFIASEYVGGSERYPPIQPESPIQERRQLQQDAFNMMGPDQLASLFQSVAQSFDHAGLDSQSDFLFGADAWHETHLVPGDELLPHGTSNFARKLTLKQYSPSYLMDPEQSLLLQAFVDAVGPWVDCTDPAKHFTELLPLHAIDQPMLLKALLACGARHLSIGDPSQEHKAAHYYEVASEDLLNSMQDPNRDSVLCTVVALALGIYEWMLPNTASTKNHLAGSRALIRECRWNAKTPSLGGACFWISVKIELLNCLQHNWLLSWDPDTWGIDMNMDHAQPHWKGDEVWLQRIIYICAKVLNFRATIQLWHPEDLIVSDSRRNEVLQEWNHYYALCEQWNNSCPRSMKPIFQIQPWQVESESHFPKIWLTKRTATVARLFYHATSFLLAMIHPLPESYKNIQQEHSHSICAYAANSKDPSIANTLVPCLGIAAASLQLRGAQEEALRILENISIGSAHSIDRVKDDLKRSWGWIHPETLDPAQIHSDYVFGQPSNLNPFLNSTDLSMDHHPYQGFYVPPHHHRADNYPYDAYLV